MASAVAEGMGRTWHGAGGSNSSSWVLETLPRPSAPHVWTGRRDSHPRSLPWEGSVLLATPRPEDGPLLLERPAGIAPASRVWKTRTLLLSYRRVILDKGWTPRCSPPTGPTPGCCVPARLSKGVPAPLAAAGGSPLLVRPPGTPDGGRTRANKKPRARFRARGLKISLQSR